MLMILAPSKTQELSAPLPPAPVSRAAFLAESAELIDQLRGYSLSELAALMKMSDKLARSTRERIRSFQLPFTQETARPSLSLFQGDVYSSIPASSYSKDDWHYAQDHLRILSGLYGILRPLDLALPYRLEMGCPLANRCGATLYAFWQDKVTAAINQALAALPQPVLVDLASQEYSRVIDRKALQGSMVQIQFKEPGPKGYRTVAIHAKRAQGRMVDFAIRNRISEVEGLQGFAEDGYGFREEDSTETRYLFTRG